MPQLLLLLAVAILALLLWRNLARQRRLRYLNRFPYQRLLDARLAARRPELSATQRSEVFAGLHDYFLLCTQARRQMLAMPSQAVDDAWHEFILFTRQYEQFCRHAFGRFLHHTPAEAMTTPTQASESLRRSWGLACAHEGIDPKAPDRLPRLFALDAALGIAGGFIYHLDCLARNHPDSSGFCASHIGCSSGCGGDSGGSDGGSDGGGCGGD
ncbi:hypothetical protein VX159_01980 [Dechloromonas sp. ZY10]|uniref:glycine-rich domain-containing protein n=1 Tax=Dechloromonas aquae TaxID=2664436 RepID=UPI003527FAEF